MLAMLSLEANSHDAGDKDGNNDGRGEGAEGEIKEKVMHVWRLEETPVTTACNPGVWLRGAEFAFCPRRPPFPPWFPQPGGDLESCPSHRVHVDGSRVWA